MEDQRRRERLLEDWEDQIRRKRLVEDQRRRERLVEYQRRRERLVEDERRRERLVEDWEDQSRRKRLVEDQRRRKRLVEDWLKKKEAGGGPEKKRVAGGGLGGPEKKKDAGGGLEKKREAGGGPEKKREAGGGLEGLEREEERVWSRDERERGAGAKDGLAESAASATTHCRETWLHKPSPSPFTILQGPDKGSQYCIRPVQGAFMNRDSTRLDNQPARPARSLGSPNPIPALWDSTQSLTLVGVVKQRGDVVWGQGMNMNGSYNSQVAVQSDHASFTEASGQKGPTKGSLGDIMSKELSCTTCSLLSWTEHRLAPPDCRTFQRVRHHQLNHHFELCLNYTPDSNPTWTHS
ncbi:unnamed protein product [Gadus morhua 'NCC']